MLAAVHQEAPILAADHPPFMPVEVLQGLARGFIQMQPGAVTEEALLAHDSPLVSGVRAYPP